MPPGLACNILTSEAELTALAGEWRQLYNRVGRNPFTAYDWVRVWWQTLGRDQMEKLHIVVGRANGRIVAILPLAVEKRRGMRVLRAGGYKAFHCCDILCEDQTQALALWKTARLSTHYDFADIRDVYPDSMCYKALSSFACRRDETEAYRLRFEWPDSATWQASLSKRMRGKIKRCMRRLEEKGPVSYGVYTGGPLEPGIIDGMVKHKVAWSQERKKHGLFDHPNVGEYFRQLVEAAAANNNLFLTWMKCGDDVVAYDLCVLYGGVIHGYVIGYNADYASYGPGVLIIMQSIGWAIDNGLTAMDHRQGDGAYKTRFSNETVQCAEFTFASTFRGRVIESAFVASRSLWRKVSGGGPETPVAVNE